jgi:hypothetical protein
MGAIRNGARTFLRIMAKACQLSKLPGFRSGVAGILGASNSTSFFTLWDPLCAFIDILVGADNWFNQIDYTNDDLGGEDRVPEEEV